MVIGIGLKKSIFFGAFCGFVVGILLMTVGAQAAAMSSARDFDGNAVIRGGCLSASECTRKSIQSGVAQVFNCFNISARDINRLGSTAVPGSVSREGVVKINGQTNPVATNAITAGRQNMSGSTTIRCGGMTFFKRPPSVSFASSPLSAFVVMRNNQFAFAILTSCGNPVMATPVRPPVAKKHKVVPPAPTAKPAPPTQTQTQVQSQTVVVNQPAAQAPVAKEIPNTGPGAVISLGALATVGGSVAHSIYQRRRL